MKSKKEKVKRKKIAAMLGMAGGIGLLGCSLLDEPTAGTAAEKGIETGELLQKGVTKEGEGEDRFIGRTFEYEVRGLTRTEISLQPGQKITILPKYEGDPPRLFDPDAPRPFAPKGSLVFGFDFDERGLFLYDDWRKSKVEFVVSRELVGKTLFLSNNNGEKPLKAVVVVGKTDAPAPWAPRWTISRSVNPIFNWDPDPQSVKYNFQIDSSGRFSSSELVASFDTFPTSGGSESPLPLPLFNLGEVARVVLGEGQYYWRVASQRNLGRPLAPEFEWSDYSSPTPFSVELGLPPFVLLEKPLEPIAVGRIQKIRFFSSADASGNIVRVSVGTTECNDSNYGRSVGDWKFMVDRRETPYGPVAYTDLFELQVDEAPKKYTITIEVVDSFDVLFRDIATVPITLKSLKNLLPPSLQKLDPTIDLEGLFSLRRAVIRLSEDTCSGTSGEPRTEFFNPEIITSDALDAFDALATACLTSITDGTIKLAKILAMPPEEIPTKRMPFVRFKLSTDPTKTVTQVLTAVCQSLTQTAQGLAGMQQGGGGAGDGTQPQLDCSALQQLNPQVIGAVIGPFLKSGQTFLDALKNAVKVDLLVNGDVFSPRIKLGNLADFVKVDLVFLPEIAFIFNIDVPIIDFESVIQTKINDVLGSAQVGLRQVFNECLPGPVSDILNQSFTNQLAAASGVLFQNALTGRAGLAGGGLPTGKQVGVRPPAPVNAPMLFPMNPANLAGWQAFAEGKTSNEQ
ncbi:MAG: hypothetical protein HYT87_12645 [Nitrospirae bacterium]|nr:hypothetical protein [Nitrospirota bacterium]